MIDTIVRNTYYRRERTVDLPSYGRVVHVRYLVDDKATTDEYRYQVQDEEYEWKTQATFSAKHAEEIASAILLIAEQVRRDDDSAS